MSAAVEPAVRPEQTLERAAGIELLGEVHGSGYRAGASLVRRPDGQVVQLGPLMYALLEAADGRRSAGELADDLCERIGRPCDEDVIAALARKLAAQGLLAGHEHNAPPRRNPLLALRWKVLITNPRVTRLLTAPFALLFRPWIVWPVVASFVAVCWLVLFREGFAAATSDAFQKPELLLLLMALVLVSAALHEIGHAAACRYGGATPGGMGAGIYLVWPAFYTDVTDAYRLPRTDRLRVDLGGIYFNAVVAVVTTAVWLVWRVDALLLLVGLQLLMMVKNLSPVIRSDGYHILSDATGIPDLYAHIKPTLLRLLPWRRKQPSALRGRARALVTVWVLVVVPVLLAMMAGAVLLLPHLLATAWDSGRTIVSAMGHEGAWDVLAGLLRLMALALPALGSLFIALRLLRVTARGAHSWSAGSALRRLVVVCVAAAIATGLAWAWWPSGQYRPVQASDRGTLGGLVSAAASPAPAPAPILLAPGKHLAVAMVPVGGATKRHPALYFVPGAHGQPPVALLSSGDRYAGAFPFRLPSSPGPGDTQALAVNTTDGGVVYNVEYALITVSNGAPVTNTNAAYAFAHCTACTTVAVAFQVVLVVGQSDRIAPINAAVAVNYECPACLTTAVADQLVITLSAQPSEELLAKLEAALKQLDAISALGANATPAEIAAQVEQVEQQVNQLLQQSGLESNSGSPTSTTTTATTSTATTSTTPRGTTTATTARTTTTSPTTTEQTTTQQTTTSTTDTTTTATTPTTTTGG